MQKCEQQKSVSASTMARYLMKGSCDGDMAVKSRDTVAVAVGGFCGTAGETNSVVVEFKADGGVPNVGGGLSTVQQHRLRADKESALTEVQTRLLNVAAFHASVSWDGMNETFALRARCAGVRLVPDLENEGDVPDLENEEFCQQLCNVYTPHVWPGSDEATQDWLLDKHETWAEAWVAFASWDHAGSPSEADAIQLFGLPGAPHPLGSNACSGACRPGS